jgi:hypothetical protein
MSSAPHLNGTPTEEACLEQPPALRLHPPIAGTTPRGLCLVVQSSDTSAEEAAAHLATAQALQAHGVTTVISEMPHASAEEARTPAGIVERQKCILAMFAFVARVFPQQPAVVLARNDGALCALALLRVDRATTRNIKALVVENGTRMRMIPVGGEREAKEVEGKNQIEAILGALGQ